MFTKTVKPENNYELIIIGGGPGGYVAAEHAGKNGIKTLIVEKENFGGVCLNKGCIPTKTLLKSAKVFHYVKNASQYGIEISGDYKFKLNWKQMQERKNDVINKLTTGVQAIVRSAKVKIVQGEAIFISDHIIRIGDELYQADKFIIATGSSPRKLNLPGFEKAQADGIIIDSTDALELKKIPKSFTVIGGGVIGVEFALLYKELGCDVTILQGLDKILEILDDDLSKTMTEILTKQGIKIITGVQVQKIDNQKLFYLKDEKQHSINLDKLLVSVGRVANTESFSRLDLAFDERKQIIVNENLQTSKRHIYAIGDVNQKLMLAHVAYKHAVIAVDHILGKKVPYNLIETPSCIYTYPEVATIGLNERDVKGIDFVVTKMSMSHLGKALSDAETEGFIKLIIAKKSGKILGCHIIGSTASDLISEISLAMQAEATIFDLAAAIHPHPTIAEIYYEVAKKALYDHFKGR